MNVFMFPSVKGDGRRSPTPQVTMQFKEPSRLQEKNFMEVDRLVAFECF